MDRVALNRPGSQHVGWFFERIKRLLGWLKAPWVFIFVRNKPVVQCLFLAKNGKKKKRIKSRTNNFAISCQHDEANDTEELFEQEATHGYHSRCFKNEGGAKATMQVTACFLGTPWPTCLWLKHVTQLRPFHWSPEGPTNRRPNIYPQTPQTHQNWVAEFEKSKAITANGWPAHLPMWKPVQKL